MTVNYPFQLSLTLKCLSENRRQVGLLEQTRKNYWICVNEVYNLFMHGDITKAIEKTYIKEISIFLSDLLKEVKNVVGNEFDTHNHGIVQYNSSS